MMKRLSMVKKSPDASALKFDGHPAKKAKRDDFKFFTHQVQCSWESAGLCSQIKFEIGLSRVLMLRLSSGLAPLANFFITASFTLPQRKRSSGIRADLVNRTVRGNDLPPHCGQTRPRVVRFSTSRANGLSSLMFIRGNVSTR